MCATFERTGHQRFSVPVEADDSNRLRRDACRNQRTHFAYDERSLNVIALARTSIAFCTVRNVIELVDLV